MRTTIQSFKVYLHQLGYSEGTQLMLPACVQEFWEQQKLTELRSVERHQVEAFYEWLQVRPLKRKDGALSEQMISHYVYALRTFFNWAEQTEQLEHNPISGLKFRRPRQQVRIPLTPAEIHALFAACNSLQERVLLHLFYSCGLRRSEAVQLNVRDLYFTTQLLYVRSGKGARRRVVPLTQKVSSELQAYYQQERSGRVVQKTKDQVAFLLNSRGGRMRGDSCLRLLQQLVARAGLERSVCLHHLRHSIATHLLQRGMRMEAVRDFLGHRWLESTQLYAKADLSQLML